eukprot:TRINITY_DN4178_c0_g1_i1.p1 TRINITY_DN4178_c0_g1~~TRINITY_DN4178_c0_g1_i1.p1  ORF type:complete len:217 (+),score=36.89 TRINITY_DN4178_c0_g1_i1:384-1034(+)
MASSLFCSRCSGDCKSLERSSRMKVASSRGRVLSPQAEIVITRQVATEVKAPKQLAHVIERNNLKRNYKSIIQEFKQLDSKEGKSNHEEGDSKSRENDKNPNIEVEHIEKVESDISQATSEAKTIDFNNLFKIEQSEVLLESPRFLTASLEKSLSNREGEARKSFIFPENAEVEEVKHVPIEEFNSKLESIRSQIGKLNREIEGINAAMNEKLSHF